MATQKNNFILYTDYFEQIQMLNVEQRGVLLTALMCYQLDEDLPKMDAITKMCYSFISADVRRNNEKYEETIQKRRDSGSKGGRQTQLNRQANQANATFATFASNSDFKQNQANQANQAKGSDKVNVNVNVNDKDNVNVNVSGSGSGNDNVQTDSTTTTTTRPTLEQLSVWCSMRGIKTNVEKFYAYNDARGWTLNGKPADWQKLLQLWIANDTGHKGATTSESYGDFDYDWIERELVNK